MNLGLNDTTLFSRSVATNERSIAVKVTSNLLKRCVLGLNVEEVDDNEFDSEPYAL